MKSPVDSGLPSVWTPATFPDEAAWSFDLSADDQKGLGLSMGAVGFTHKPVEREVVVSTLQGVKTFAERKDLGAGARVVWLSGRASPKAAQGLEAHGWSLRENVALK